jgi:hypothetical protein
MPQYRTFEQHLDPKVGPKRILSLDGGGLRGVLTLGMLREIETLLRKRHGDDPAFRLGHYFDLIAGTSTGAIIAAALSLGMTVDEVYKHYLRLGEVVFKRGLFSFGVLDEKYDAAAVGKALRDVFGDRTLESQDFLTGLVVVTKRLDTGSAWPITNNPNSRYYHGGTKSTTIPNKHYPLWQVVRASTAAPHYFDPETIEIGRAEGAMKLVKGEFVDGGVSPSNNPTLVALMMATMEGYRFGWRVGEKNLQIVSVGTGKADPEIGLSNALQSITAVHAVRSLAALMEDCADQVESIMQWLSVSPTARRIDREMDKAQPVLGGTAICTYLRYNVLLRPDWFAENLGETIASDKLKALEVMDKPGNIPELDRVGRLAGRSLVQEKHFDREFFLPSN